MSEAPTSGDPPAPEHEPSAPLVPKRGAIPTPRWEIEVAQPYVPDCDPADDHDPQGGPKAPKDLRPPA